MFAPTFEIQPLELELTYPGWVQPAIVSLEPDRPLIAISVHAPIIRTYSITTLHRIFSDLTHVIEHSRSPMVLGGDFNAGLQFDARNRYPTHHVLFTRIAAFGLTNCVRRFNPPFAETYRPVRGKASWEIDHLFVSSFADAALRSCRVVQDATTRRISDHNPIVAEFDLAVLPRLRPRMRRGKRSIESLLAEVT